MNRELNFSFFFFFFLPSCYLDTVAGTRGQSLGMALPKATQPLQRRAGDSREPVLPLFHVTDGC